MVFALFSWCLLGRRSQLEGYSAATGSVRDAFGILFGLVLALSIGSVATRNREALTATASEATAIAQLTRGVRSFPVEDRTILRAAINEYVHAVTDDEFATM